MIVSCQATSALIIDQAFNSLSDGGVAGGRQHDKQIWQTLPTKPFTLTFSRATRELEFRAWDKGAAGGEVGFRQTSVKGGEMRRIRQRKLGY
jgi:hypothetical protein